MFSKTCLLLTDFSLFFRPVAQSSVKYGSDHFANNAQERNPPMTVWVSFIPSFEQRYFNGLAPVWRETTRIIDVV